MKKLESKSKAIYKQSEEDFNQSVKNYLDDLTKREIKLMIEGDEVGKIRHIEGPIFKITRGDGGDINGRGEIFIDYGVYCKMTPKGAVLSYFESDQYFASFIIMPGCPDIKKREERKKFTRHQYNLANHFSYLLSEVNYDKEEAFVRVKKEIEKNVKRMQEGKAPSEKYLTWFKEHKIDGLEESAKSLYEAVKKAEENKMISGCSGEYSILEKDVKAIVDKIEKDSYDEKSTLSRVRKLDDTINLSKDFRATLMEAYSKYLDCKGNKPPIDFNKGPEILSDAVEKIGNLRKATQGLREKLEKIKIEKISGKIEHDAMKQMKGRK